MRAIGAMAGAILFIAGCSSTTTSPTSPAAPAAEPSIAAALPPILDLCPLPALAPADLRAKPGYIEFAASVIDSNGAPVTGLKQSDFAVVEAARSLPVAYFRETTSKTPTSLFIIGDVSRTMFNKTVVKTGNLSKIRGALDKGAEDINDCDEVGVIVTGGSYPPGIDPAAYDLPPALSEVTLVQAFTTDHEEAISKMENLAPSGPDRLSDAINIGIGQLDAAHYPDRAMVIMTDGLDQNAIDESARILEQARGKGIALWVIGIGDPEAKNGALAPLTGTSRLDLAAVKRLATAGNGRVILARPVDDDGGVSLALAISTIGKQLGQGYAIGAVASSAEAKPILSLTRTADATLRAAIVPTQVLAEAAARHPRPPAPRCVASAAAAPPAAVSSRPGYTQVRVSVLDPDRRAVRDLKQSDFAVSSDTSQFPVVYVHEDQTGIPRSIIIAVDTSGSMQPKLGNVRREMSKLLDGLNPCDEVALMAFSGKPFLLQSFTTDRRLVERRMAMLHAYGQTALYDSVAASVALLAKGTYQDRTLILITDGMDNVSKTSRSDALDSVARNHVQVYAIGIGNASAPTRVTIGAFMAGDSDAVDKELLDTIAIQSGGRDFIVKPMGTDNGREFADAIAAVSSELEHGYEVGFLASPPNATATVTVVNQPDDTVHLVAAAPAPSAPSSSAPPQAAH